MLKRLLFILWALPVFLLSYTIITLTDILTLTINVCYYLIKGNPQKIIPPSDFYAQVLEFIDNKMPK